MARLLLSESLDCRYGQNRVYAHLATVVVHIAPESTTVAKPCQIKIGSIEWPTSPKPSPISNLQSPPASAQAHLLLACCSGLPPYCAPSLRICQCPDRSLSSGIVTNGPFKLESWKRGESIVFSRNLEYHGRFKGNPQQVQLFSLAEWSTRLQMYEAGDLDMLGVASRAKAATWIWQHGLAEEVGLSGGFPPEKNGGFPG